MHKRKIIIIATTAILAVSSVVYAHWHGHRLASEHAIEHMVSKMARHLELSDQQEDEIELVLESNTGEWSELRESGLLIRNRILALDPESESYQEEVQVLANELATLVREKTLTTADVVREVYGILEPDQRAEARKILSSRMGHRHNKAG